MRTWEHGVREIVHGGISKGITPRSRRHPLWGVGPFPWRISTQLVTKFWRNDWLQIHPQNTDKTLWPSLTPYTDGFLGTNLPMIYRKKCYMTYHRLEYWHNLFDHICRRPAWPYMSMPDIISITNPSVKGLLFFFKGKS